MDLTGMNGCECRPTSVPYTLALQLCCPDVSQPGDEYWFDLLIHSMFVGFCLSRMYK